MEKPFKGNNKAQLLDGKVTGAPVIMPLETLLYAASSWGSLMAGCSTTDDAATFE